MLHQIIIQIKFIKVNIKKFECLISYLPNLDVWYYYLNSNDERDIRYGSLWDGIEFNSRRLYKRLSEVY